jgi:hypothetical protein
MTIGDIIGTSDTSGRNLLKAFLKPLFNERSQLQQNLFPGSEIAIEGILKSKALLKRL